LKIVLGSDHAAIDLRKWLVAELQKLGHETVEVGARDTTAYDYPDAADELAACLHEFDFGIVICGTGIGISVRANRYSHVRCALCTTEYMAEMAREHNDANVLALGARRVFVRAEADLRGVRRAGLAVRAGALLQLGNLPS
jgi:ribose 5-phosphate isomerase B